jgi:hypothetical protein
LAAASGACGRIFDHAIRAPGGMSFAAQLHDLWLIAPALALLAAELFLVPRVADFTLMLVVIGRDRSRPVSA